MATAPLVVVQEACTRSGRRAQGRRREARAQRNSCGDASGVGYGAGAPKLKEGADRIPDLLLDAQALGRRPTSAMLPAPITTSRSFWTYRAREESVKRARLANRA